MRLSAAIARPAAYVLPAMQAPALGHSGRPVTRCAYLAALPYARARLPAYARARAYDPPIISLF
jgi:hypothetical protein